MSERVCEIYLIEERLRFKEIYKKILFFFVFCFSVLLIFRVLLKIFSDGLLSFKNNLNQTEKFRKFIFSICYFYSSKFSLKLLPTFILFLQNGLQVVRIREGKNFKNKKIEICRKIRITVSVKSIFWQVLRINHSREKISIL